MRTALLVLAIAAAGCAPTRPDPYAGYDYSRPVPDRVVDGVQVVGPFGARDVDAISALVRSQTAEPLLRIVVPLEARQRYYRGETDVLPVDRAEVYTGQACEGRCGSGQVFVIVSESGAWSVESVGDWRG